MPLGRVRFATAALPATIGLVTALAACGDSKAYLVADSTHSTTAIGLVAAPVIFTAGDSTFNVDVPARWAGAYRVDSLMPEERGSARPGGINIVYLPRDSSVLPQTLVVVLAYDSATWARERNVQGPPPGDSVAARNGLVFVLGLPQSNPFKDGSVDALKFDSLALTPAEKASLVHPRI